MKKIILAAFLLIAASPAYAFECSPSLSTMLADNAFFYAGQTNSCQGQRYNPEGVIYSANTVPSFGVSSTAEQTLATYSLPANSLDAVGRRLRISMSAGISKDTIGLYFGSVGMSATSSDSNIAGRYQMEVVKTGAGTQVLTGFPTGGSQGVSYFQPMVSVSTGAEADTSAIVIKATCKEGTGTSFSCKLYDFVVEWLN